MTDSSALADGSSSRGAGAVAEKPRFSHLVLQTRRFEAMKAWYAQVFDAEVVHEDPALCFMTYDEESHRFAIANLDVLKPGGATGERGEIGVNHAAYTYADVGALLETYARLRDAGTTPYWPIHHGFTLSLYYQDPDGNRVELQVETCSGPEAFDYMRSDRFAANPVGVTFDPEALLARYRAGAPASELLAFPEGEAAAIPAEHGLA